MTAVMLPVDPHLLERDDLTVDDVTSLPEDLRYELIDGRLVVSPSATPIHMIIGRQVANAIDEFCPEEFFVSTEQSMLVNRRSELRPDVMVARSRWVLTSPVPSSDVMVVVEVLSPSTEDADRRDKRERYQQIGIPAYWIIDPLTERITLTELRLSPGGYQDGVRTDELVTLDEPWKITLDLPQWTRRRDHLRASARP